MRSPLCCLTSDTHSLSVLLLGHVTIPFSREQHNVSIVLEYPSRSNLNCLIVVLRGLGRKGDESRFHSGLSTSVEWGKPLSIFYHFKRTFSLFSGGMGHQLTNTHTPVICFTKLQNIFHPHKPLSIFFSLPSLDVFYFRVWHFCSSCRIRTYDDLHVRQGLYH
jgi:hypothetical protein